MLKHRRLVDFLDREKPHRGDVFFAAKDGGELNPRWRFFILTGSGPIV
jgi:hypothetical protein